MRFALSLLIILFTSVVSAQQFTPTQYILYKNGASPIPAQAPAAWLPPGFAYTSITIPATLLKWKNAGLQALHAEAQIVWRPNATTGGNTGVALLLCPGQQHAGTELVGCQFLAWFAANNQALASYTPGCQFNSGNVMPCRGDFTAALQSGIANATTDVLFFVMATYGNGTNGPDVYDVEFFIDWGHQ